MHAQSKHMAVLLHWFKLPCIGKASHPRLFAMSYLGCKQRSKRAALEAGQLQESILAQRLVSDWAWGYIFAKDVQRYASAAVADGLEHNSLKKLAAIGGGGRTPMTLRRDLVAHLIACQLATSLQFFMVPFDFAAGLIPRPPLALLVRVARVQLTPNEEDLLRL